MMSAITSEPVEATVEWSISAGASVTDKIPEKLPRYLVKGKPIRQFAIMDRYNSEQLAGSVLLQSNIFSNSSDNGTLVFNSENSSNAGANDLRPLHRLAAKISIMEKTSFYYSLPISERNEEVKNEIIKLSLASGVLSEFTALVGIGENRAESKIIRRRTYNPTTYNRKSAASDLFLNRLFILAMLVASITFPEL